MILHLAEIDYKQIFKHKIHASIQLGCMAEQQIKSATRRDYAWS